MRVSLIKKLITVDKLSKEIGWQKLIENAEQKRIPRVIKRAF